MPESQEIKRSVDGDWYIQERDEDGKFARDNNQRYRTREDARNAKRRLYGT